MSNRRWLPAAATMGCALLGWVALTWGTAVTPPLPPPPFDGSAAPVAVHGSASWASPPPQPSASPFVPTDSIINVLPMVVLGAVILVSIVLLVMVLRWLLSRRFRPGRSGRATADGLDAGDVVQLDEKAAQKVAADLEHLRSRLAHGDDVDDAVVACWRRLELVAAEASIPRASHDTPGDYVARLLAGTRAAPADLEELAVLYRRAQFSQHHSTELNRASAEQCVARLVESLGDAG